MLALVGFRKAMDYFPSVFSQKELYWLDNLMPASTKKGSKERDKKEQEGGKIDKPKFKLTVNLLCINSK